MTDYDFDCSSMNQFERSLKSSATGTLAAAAAASADLLKTESTVNLPLDRRICLIGGLKFDESFSISAQYFNYPVITSDTGLELLDDHSCCTIFVADSFDTEFFHSFQKHKHVHQLYGSCAFLQYHKLKIPLPGQFKRPIFNLAMHGVVVCFNGIRDKVELTNLVLLIHQMGGSIRRSTGSEITHLISNTCMGKKYQYAVTFRVPVMSMEWVSACWEQRHNINFKAASNDVILTNKLKPFHGASVCFMGFSDEETDHMRDILKQNGGELVNSEDVRCSHIVVDESLTVKRTSGLTRALIVKAAWFWASVQNEFCADEKDYIIDFKNENNVCSPQNSIGAGGGAGGGNGVVSVLTPDTLLRRKRKRITLSQLVRIDSPIFQQQTKRRSSIGDSAGGGGGGGGANSTNGGLLSTSNSFLETTQNSDLLVYLDPAAAAASTSVVVSETAKTALSRRQLTFLELVQTESNYVNILHTIMTMFKKHLEEMPENEALLNNTEIKMIFGNLPPIYDVHKQMLEDLREASKNWFEDISIGNIIKRRSDQLLKAYPPFVNYLETSKEILAQCDQTKPRFHAFLKVCQTRPECGRQRLQDLLVRPVQRLPSISLLLGDILKHTNKSNGDYSVLESALNNIKEIMTHINEDKRKTECQLLLFDIFNDISNCPPSLVASHRSFVTKCDCNQLSEGPSSARGNHLTLFLFSDYLEICKKKSKALNNMKSPNPLAPSQHSSCSSSVSVQTSHHHHHHHHHHKHSSASKHQYKHVELVPLSTIKKVFDFTETEDCHKSFAFVSLNSQDLREKIYSFAIVDENVCKLTFLKNICRQIANNVCTTDSDKFLTVVESSHLDVETTKDAQSTSSSTQSSSSASSNYGTLSRAFKFATKTKIKVGRAFSFNKTPTNLKRAVSSVISPQVAAAAAAATADAAPTTASDFSSSTKQHNQTMHSLKRF